MSDYDDALRDLLYAIEKLETVLDSGNVIAALEQARAVVRDKHNVEYHQQVQP